jgi:hypothetical protein
MITLFEMGRRGLVFAIKGLPLEISSGSRGQWLFILSILTILSGSMIHSTHSNHAPPQAAKDYLEQKSNVPIFASPYSDFQDLTDPTPSDIETERLINTIIHEASTIHGVDPILIKAIVMAESRFKPQAVSKRGAKGLMQLMPNTAALLGVTDIFDPVENIHGGVRHFRYLLNTYNGNIPLSLAAYNAGMGKVKDYRGIPPFKATKMYIKDVLDYYEIFKE